MAIWAESSKINKIETSLLCLFLQEFLKVAFPKNCNFGQKVLEHVVWVEQSFEMTSLVQFENEQGTGKLKFFRSKITEKLVFLKNQNR